MTNLQAAVGVAQLERVEGFIRRKREIAELYDELLAGVPGLTGPVEQPGYTNVYWMYSVLVDEMYGLTRNELIPALRERNIDSRPFFHPLDTLPPYKQAEPCPTALDLSRRGLNLPSSPALTDEQVVYICDVLKELAR
jgi:perosamine synthetase